MDQHPPLYYLLLHFWLALFGDGEVAVRALSALLGTLTIPALYLLGRRLADEKVGLLAALLLAVSPFHVRFAQETRMYTLLALNASLALCALVRLLDGVSVSGSRSGKRETSNLKPEDRNAWLDYVVFTAAALWTHNTAVFFLLTANLLILTLRLPCLRNTQYAIRHWLLAQLAVLPLWLPWLPAFLTQSATVYREFWLPAPTWETVAGVVGAFVSDFLPLTGVGLYAVVMLFVGLALLGLVYFRRRPAHIMFLLVTLITPFVGEWLVSLRRPIFYDRTLIWASLPLYLLLAAGVRQLETRFSSLSGRVGRCFWGFRGRKAMFCQSKTWFIITLMVLAINSLSLHEYYVHFQKEEWDEAAALVAEQVEPDDLILFNATWTQIPFDYYFRRLYNRPVAEHGLPVDLFERGVLEPKVATDDLPRLRALVRGHERVWLVYSHDWYTDPQRLIPPALEAQLDLLDRREFHGLQVWLYVRQ
ncbi:MAG: glycosyltransferase family 39 protein [Anaerolineae bacterium]